MRLLIEMDIQENLEKAPKLPLNFNSIGHKLQQQLQREDFPNKL